MRSLAVQHVREQRARQLHDAVIRELFAISISLESARSLLPFDPDRVDERLGAAVDGLDAAIRELRNHTFRLQPDDAASLGLTGGLAELAREYEINTLLRPSLYVHAYVEAHVPPALVPHLLEIVREALVNCAKHADAVQVEIAAQVNAGSVTLWVRDDGVGFVPGTPPSGRGLDHIRQRADALHADLEIRSTPGAGTRVRVIIPPGTLDTPPMGAPLTATPSSPSTASDPAGRP